MPAEPAPTIVPSSAPAHAHVERKPIDYVAIAKAVVIAVLPLLGFGGAVVAMPHEAPAVASACPSAPAVAKHEERLAAIDKTDARQDTAIAVHDEKFKAFEKVETALNELTKAINRANRRNHR